ncbi:MAG: hypothetical protein AAF744_08705, partial [Pseudomonadota bacterium]
SFGTAAFGHNAQHHHHHTHGTFAQGGQQVIVSCYRGPWNDVIWDRPNAVFIDSLVAVGYQYERAYAIARRVCRDDALVGNTEGLRRTMQRILREGNR